MSDEETTTDEGAEEQEETKRMRKRKKNRTWMRKDTQSNMGYSLTHTGILVSIVGLVLVNTFGLTDNCSSEITAKLIEYAPVVTGGLMAWIGRMKAKGPTTLGGFRK